MAVNQAEPGTGLHSSQQSRMPVRAISMAIVVAVLLYAGMAAYAGGPALRRAVDAIPASVWLEVAGLSLASYLARFIRWHRFLQRLGHPIPWQRHLAIYWSGFALTLSPGKAGETVRSLYLRPYGVPYSQSIGTFVAERLLDLVAVGLLAGLTSLWLPEQRGWVLVVLACCLCGVFLLRSRLVQWVEANLARRAPGQFASEGLHTVKDLLSGSSLATALPLSFLAWSAQGLALHALVDALGYEFGVLDIVSVYCLSILAGAASFIPGGLGATEAAMIVLLGAVGLTQCDAILAAMVGRGLTLWLAIGLGLLGHCYILNYHRRAMHLCKRLT